MENDPDLTIETIAPLIRNRKISPVELTRFFLERISRLQPSLNAYITVTGDAALIQARLAEKEIARGAYKGPLHGIPVSLKDLFHTQGVRTTAGSKILRRFLPKENAAVVNRLLQRGCVLLGKTNMHEFAFGVTNVNPHYGPVRNPWDRERISGGSSGGSAVTVVSAMALASFGTDTGGSIRIPAAACGCVGLKPTFGCVPMAGVIPLARSLDHAGPLARSVVDAALMLDAVSDYPLWQSGRKGGPGEIRRGVQSCRIGIPRQYYFDRIQPDVRKIVMDAAEVFRQLGANVREVTLKGMEETAWLAAEITGDEGFAFHEKWLDKKAKDYGNDVRLRLEQCRKATAAAFIRAREKKLAYIERLTGVFEEVDLLMAPTLPLAAPRIGQNEVLSGRSMEDVRLALLRLTRPANLAGLPAVSIPCGFSAERLPVGLQLIGRWFEEAAVLRAAYAYEQATPWHLAFPPDGP
jgi:aspartyl-tRNA(Asn)/glutamyl-tRNA(Gln) amidotransferase subunit A